MYSVLADFAWRRRKTEWAKNFTGGQFLPKKWLYIGCVTYQGHCSNTWGQGFDPAGIYEARSGWLESAKGINIGKQPAASLLFGLSLHSEAENKMAFSALVCGIWPNEVWQYPFLLIVQQCKITSSRQSSPWSYQRWAQKPFQGWNNGCAWAADHGESLSGQ